MKGRKHKATGGENAADEDLKSKPEKRVNAPKIEDAAEERKSGGRAKRKSGGKAEMKAEGEKAKHHAGRKPRKNGGRTGSDGMPFSSARHGKNPSGRSEMAESEG